MHRAGFPRGKGNRNPSYTSAMESRTTWECRGSSSSQASSTGGEVESESLPFVVGNCPDMCPARERAERERLRDLAVFERLNGNPRKTSSSLAVKKFCRTISSVHVHASDLRPLPVLQDTLAHLLNLLESTDQPFEVVHEFVFDRTRSIKQDLSMQNISGHEAVDMYEQMVKFHIKSHHKLLARENVSASTMHYLNLEQLKKSLKTLYDLYDVNRSSGVVSKHEAEFYSFHVLLHLGSNCQSMGESLATWFWRLQPHLLKSKDLYFARSILRCFRINNFKQFFCIVAEQASYLQLCLLEPLFNEVRAHALSSINLSGYKLHPYPLPHLAKLLMLKVRELHLEDEEETRSKTSQKWGSVYCPLKLFVMPDCRSLIWSLFVIYVGLRRQLTKQGKSSCPPSRIASICPEEGSRCTISKACRELVNLQTRHHGY